MQATHESSSAPHKNQIDTIEAALRLLCHPRQVVELRVLNTPRGTVSGYFTDMTLLAHVAEQWSGRCNAVYVTLNSVTPALLVRASNRVIERVKHATSDTDIVRRLWLLFDLDAVRPAGISARDEEHQAALRRALECLLWLRTLGVRAYILADSGNGAHILVRIDLPNDKASTDLVRRCLEAVALRFSDDKVVVDLTVYNAARIVKLYGTKACKGDDTLDRPHRVAQILEVSESQEPEPQELLARLAALAPEEPQPESRYQHNGYGGSFDLQQWIATHRLDVRGPHDWKGGHKWILPVCPFNVDHNNRAAVLLQFSNGAIAFRCLHNGCTGNDWHALRDLLEPGWRNGNHERQTDRDKPDEEGGRESPRPLIRKLPDATPYPVERLGKLAPVVEKLHATIQAPLALCAQSVLAAVDLATQGHANIIIDGRDIPLSENFLSIGESGERKSAVDTEVLRPHRAYEKQMAEAYKDELQAYENDFAAYKKARDDALKKAKTRDEKRQALEEIGSPPEEPLWPILIVEEPTYEGLIKLLLYGQPSLGLFADEGGRFIGGYGMSQEQQLKTAAGLCQLWDGKRVSRVRAGDGATLLYGKRVSIHLMAQPSVAQRLLGNPLLIDQGYMSRCLVTCPVSTAGTRPYKAVNLRADKDLREYEVRIAAILKAPLPLADKKQNELAPRLLPLSDQAKSLWVAFHDAVEGRLAENQPFAPIRGFANKAPEHALRLAGILALYEDLSVQKLPVAHMAAGIDLAQHYLDEALRLFHSSQTNPDLSLAEKLLVWAQQHGEYVALVDIYQRGLTAIRDAATARTIAKILEAHGWFIPVFGGMDINGQFRREVWKVHP